MSKTNKRKKESVKNEKEHIVQAVMSKYFEKKKEEKIGAIDNDDSDHKETTHVVKKRRKVTNDDRNDRKWEPPHWKEHWENILAMRIRNKHLEPRGCDTIGDTIADDKIRRLHVLVSLMLSSQTKDTMTIAAMDRLLEHGFTVQYALDIDIDELGKIIYPVGFWRRKAQYIKDTCQILRDKYNDDIPNTIESLCALPGVGPKMAYLTMDFAWKSNQGIGVDVHVHRISHRLGWLPYDTKTPEQTRLALESWIPRDLWNQINHNIVRFGQTQCFPVKPRCSTCLNRNICPASTSKDTVKNLKQK
ncbi:unnamed protein product [Adineta steineri]|uniref:Endonuclease III homolog n=1 Tax=Adineta steineri TaxID=433720 RepID=A0A819BBD2_9BILA|nr:unnamed protein product [Adineta steineri]CAF3789576.1 unnamed protein product [Adineta steineri]